MAELTFKSAGVSTREIDLSGPTPQTPQGVPAGIIGTSVEGPAFVPLTFGSFTDFVTIFGATDGKKFGPLAVNEWMKSSRAGTYIRVLGIGDGKKRDSGTGIVTNAGFSVGDKTVQDNGLLGNNPFSNETLGVKGRTYFLGSFMSESNGSTIFSEAGIQGTAAPTSATLVDAIDIAGIAASDKFTITVPTSAGGDGLVYTVLFDTTTNIDADSGATTYGVSTQRIADDNDGAAVLILAINGQPDAGSQYKYGNNDHSDDNNVFKFKIPGITASTGTSSSKITLTMDTAGSSGNVANVLAAITGFEDALLLESAFVGGTEQNHAVPILRGVLLAPSGVILHLSGNNMVAPGAPGVADTAIASAGDLMGRKGGVTGSVDLASQEFVMAMNGFKGDASNPTIVTASFDMTSTSYFGNVFNKDPLKIEEKGHLLYGQYDIYPAVANVTGSGAITAGSENSGKLDIGFLLTGSQVRGGSTTAEHADYEDFQDRFTHAESPFVISQGFDSPGGYDLFKLIALDSGESGGQKFKISIENLLYRQSSYGTFDILIRKFGDTDDERKVIESHRGLSLDPGSDRYVGRVIGDQHIFFNFDNNLESQKLIVDGVHPSRSRFVRVELSNALKKNEIPNEALPFGFRGPRHLNTSGSLLSGDNGSVYATSDLIQRVTEPPFPMRKKVAKGTGLNQVIDTGLYWGMKTEQFIDPLDPSKTAAFDESIATYSKHFPNHRKTVTPFAVGNNAGAADLTGGTVLDCDRFNNNRFSLEKIKVVTGSNTRANPARWVNAEFIRDGNIVANETAKTRKFKADDLQTVSNRKFAKFTLPMQGGFDGTNIFNKDKYELTNNAIRREMIDTAQGETSGPTVAAYRKAVDVMGSKSDAEIKLLAIPGIRHSSVTDFAISAVESRFDSLYIMDIEERDAVNTVITSSVQNPHVLNTVNDFKNRALNSSFAAAYFPDLTTLDPATGGFVQVPPSVAVLGAYGQNDVIGHPWTAPAGFTRGALDSIEMASVTLNRDNLDDLYDADINPITSFPGTGITVWGQKTLLQSASALDRVNVRRLLIDVRRKVRNIANTLLFEPNRVETLEKFSSLVNPILQRIQSQSGVDRYKVVIDTTTTTQADVENNTIRGKIFLQPTRTVEFVALDFVVTNAGSELL